MSSEIVVADFPGLAVYPFDSSPGRALTYTQHLRALQPFEHSMRFGIDRAAKDIIGSNEQWAKRGYTVVHEDMNRAVLVLSQEIARSRQEAKDSADHLAIMLSGGLANIASSLRLISRGIDEWVRLARTPSMNFAVEQFQRAVYQAKQGWYPEALRSIKLAIHGLPPAHVGCESQSEFHLLLGQITIGSWLTDQPEADDAIIDLPSAEKSFLNAYRYHVRPKSEREKTEILLFAARAAFLQKKIEDAISYSRKALEWSPNDASVHCQLASYLAYRGGEGTADAIAVLSQALAIDIGVLATVTVSGLFDDFPKIFDSAKAATAGSLIREYRALDAQFVSGLLSLERFSVNQLQANVLVRDELFDLANQRSHAATIAEQEGLLGLDEAVRSLKKITPQLEELFAVYKTRAEDACRIEMQKTFNNAVRRGSNARDISAAADRELSESNADQNALRSWSIVIGGLLSAWAVAAFFRGESLSGFLLSAAAFNFLVIYFWLPNVTKRRLAAKQHRASQRRAETNFLRVRAVLNKRIEQIRSAKLAIESGATELANSEISPTRN